MPWALPKKTGKSNTYTRTHIGALGRMCGRWHPENLRVSFDNWLVVFNFSDLMLAFIHSVSRIRSGRVSACVFFAT